MKTDLSIIRIISGASSSRGLTATGELMLEMCEEIEKLRLQVIDLQSQLDAYQRQMEWNTASIDDVD